uniref:Cyclic nucleotide-binding domain-containing protein n=1 Tax=Macrostomum lignano TaxID=282301 RepID=A0A1I8F3P2_9PLAT
TTSRNERASQRGPVVGQDTSNDACLSNAAKQNQTEFLAATTAAMKTIIWLELARLAGGGRAPLWFIARHCPEQSRLFCRHHLLRELRRRPFSTTKTASRATRASGLRARVSSRDACSRDSSPARRRCNASSAVRAATAEAEAPFFQRPLQQQRPQSALEFQRILAARAARNFQAKSARARLRMQTANASAARGSATGMQLLTVTGGGVGGNISGSSFGDEDLDSGDESQRQRESGSSQKLRPAAVECGIPPLLKQPRANHGATDEGAEDSDSGSSCRSCLEMVTAQRAGVEKPQAAAGPAGGKKPGLKMAMADFTRKIEDNEGTEISTFSFLGEKDKPAPDEEEEVGQDSAADVGAPAFGAPIDLSRESLRQAAKQLHQHKKKYKNMTPLNRMRRAVKTVNLLIKACTTKEEQTRKNQQRMMTFSDIASSLAQDSQSDELNFQLSYYKAKKEMTLSPEAQEILRLHPFLRTKEMLHTAMVSLQTAVEAFSEFPTNMKQSLVKWAGMRTAVSVALKKPTGEPFNKTVAFLRKGESFGELALLYGGKRSATVYCKDEVELLAVSREDFIDIFMNLESEDEPEHISFLRDIPTLNGWPIDQLPYDNPKVCMFAYFSLSFELAEKGIVLCRDSNSADSVLIVKSGHCLVMKDLQPCASTIPRLRSRQRMCDSYPVEQDTDDQRYLEFMQRDCLPEPKSGDRGGVGQSLPRLLPDLLASCTFS